ncbi:uncharacterized protein LOC129771735 [Toxorhynchites rutilus septentrionalis]|uniref:uncharacterized protein LOC129771735 n=1 Tax=Toxorhynchites rutilus septentrionalis TaxID=329112 RepID=UPI00247AA78C|nr:uncharacterized protein LOC129771735 [Toxorhynchites rutilus septentrionalis]
MFGITALPRCFCMRPAIFVYQNLYATKSAARNKPKTENFKSYEDLGKMKQTVFREHSDEEGLGPIPYVNECAKMGEYKNPEYFSYHNYTYYDFHMGCECMHQPQPSALEEKDLVHMTRRTCCDAMEIRTDQMCAPPTCTVDCMKEKALLVDDKPSKEEIALQPATEIVLSDIKIYSESQSNQDKKCAEEDAAEKSVDSAQKDDGKPK